MDKQKGKLIRGLVTRLHTVLEERIDVGLESISRISSQAEEKVRKNNLDYENVLEVLFRELGGKYAEKSEERKSIQEYQKSLDF